MTQNELLYILTIAEHGNITRAAQELFISQPSLSESLNKVEQEFGRTIFDRTQEGLIHCIRSALSGDCQKHPEPL